MSPRGNPSHKLSLPRLIVITDWSLPRERLFAALEDLCTLGPRVALQHRAPDLPTRRFLEDARALKTLTSARGVPLFINGRLDVALLVEAHLHLPANGLLPADARAHLPAGRLISAAVHDTAEARHTHGADFALVSPVFAPGSKPGDTRAPLGPAGFATLASRLPCPAFALGGISPETAAAVPGAAGLAVVSAILRAPHPRAIAEQLLLEVRTPGMAPRSTGTDQ
ncbi:MAG: thiamine phosphate synthase [Myxococcaceae bacterium]|nr:thiamine phosphate synthase [Myxococcaceae bacterium]MCI0669541.1 thiamine phosphate synthase [Myxococcaceae bacterium]